MFMLVLNAIPNVVLYRPRLVFLKDFNAFSTQWEYEQHGRKNTKNFYPGSKHITNIDEKLWRKLTTEQPTSKEQQHQGRGQKVWLVEFYAPW